MTTKDIARDIDLISSNLDPLNFFKNYIDIRKPAKFDSVIDDKDFLAMKKWTDLNYLNNAAGDVFVKVEERNSLTDRYGEGKEISKRFKDFLSLIEKNYQNNYLTTQDLTYTIDGQPSILSEPLLKLQTDFPMRPKIMGHLIPQNINLWMGCSNEASTSGLHHDFHDNLYILLSGQKHFTLFEPNEHNNMYLIGKIVKFHQNGRINYEGQVTLADGSDASAQQAIKASIDLEKAALKLTKTETIGNVTSDIEDEIETALEAALDAEIGKKDDENDPFSDEDEDSCSDNSDSIYEDNDEIVYDDDHDNDDNQNTKKHKSKHFFVAKDLPNNFSKVDSSLTLQELQDKFPLYLDAYYRRYEVTLNAGEMLYLPAGWFHEVKSKNCGDKVHMAMNYWFHPPDNSDFNKPYISDFWKNDWIARGYDS